MKCCQRIAVDLNGVQPLAKKKTILVNALDCFASCLPLADGRMAVARAICKNIDVPEYEVCIEILKPSFDFILSAAQTFLLNGPLIAVIIIIIIVILTIYNDNNENSNAYIVYIHKYAYIIHICIYAL